MKASFLFPPPSHQGLNESHFDVFIGHLEKSLLASGVPEYIAKEAREVFESFRWVPNPKVAFNWKIKEHGCWRRVEGGCREEGGGRLDNGCGTVGR